MLSPHWNCRPEHDQAVVKLIPDLRRPEGVVVAARKTNAPYSGPPLQTGDVIYEVNRHVVNGVEALRNPLSYFKIGHLDCAPRGTQRALMYIPLQLD